ncbi:MAG: nuclear transport factor 2 family protein [Solirubrobacterales bacterium]
MRSDAFRAAVEAEDFSEFDRLFAEDATFSSPVVFKAYEGREAIRVILNAVLSVFEDFRYIEQVDGGGTAFLMFEARVGDRHLQGVDILRFDDEDRISHLTVMVRPMSGMHALAERMREMLEAAGAA